MDARSELEEAVRRTWDPVTVAVYADQLQADGDLRGELIALDLAIAARGPQPELIERRTVVEGLWLGLEDLPPDARRKIAATEHGFVTFLTIRDLRPYRAWIGHLDHEYPRLPVDAMVAVTELFERLAEPIAMISQTSTYVDLPTELVLRAVTRETLGDYDSFAQHLERERDELPATTLVHLWIERNA